MYFEYLMWYSPTRNIPLGFIVRKTLVVNQRHEGITQKVQMRIKGENICHV